MLFEIFNVLSLLFIYICFYNSYNSFQIFADCDMALRLNENSFKAHLYKAKAYKELEETDKLSECRKELDEKFSQHADLIKYFLDKKEGYGDGDEDED